MCACFLRDGGCSADEESHGKNLVDVAPMKKELLNLESERHS